jgi:hypothetical protein
MMTETHDDNGKSKQRARSFVWYALTVLAVVAIIFVNAGKKVINDAPIVEREEKIIMDQGMVGAMTPKKPKPIQQISILGERNSGTRWLYT